MAEIFRVLGPCLYSAVRGGGVWTPTLADGQGGSSSEGLPTRVARRCVFDWYLNADMRTKSLYGIDCSLGSACLVRFLKPFSWGQKCSHDSLLRWLSNTLPLLNRKPAVKASDACPNAYVATYTVVCGANFVVGLVQVPGRPCD